MLLGNVQRNQTLRSLVRYSIQKDDGTPVVEVVDPEPGREPRAPSTEPSPPASRVKRSSSTER